MSTRLYECSKCKYIMSINDIDDDLKKGHECPVCKPVEKLKHIGTAGTSMN